MMLCLVVDRKKGWIIQMKDGKLAILKDNRKDKGVDQPNGSVINKAIFLYKKYKEEILYLFFGGMTFCVGIGTYALFNIVFFVNVLMANALSWCAGVSFAFFTNRKWVFEADNGDREDFWKQLYLFVGARILTLLIQEMLLYIFVTLIMLPSLPTKIITEIINIILNYLLSKLVVFNIHS